MTQNASPGQLALDAEALYAELRRGVAALMTPQTRLVGIVSGGQWLAERLQADLQQDLRGRVAAGAITSTLHRDDFARRGLAGGGQTQLPFEIEGADVLLLDDVLYTGRTIRAVVNELFDYGRPARVRLAVLVDRGGRELPIAPDFAAARFVLPAHQSLDLARGDGQAGDQDGRFTFRIDGVPA
jgi:pyrimidine operon attenuation protein/uracil phosphoribosyltransferase